MRRRYFLTVTAACASLLACNAILGLGGDSVLGGPSNDDGGLLDGTLGDAGTANDSGGLLPDGALPEGAPGLRLAAGILGGRGYLDGPPESARFTSLTALARDNSGNHYVVDGNRNVIRKVAAGSNEVTTFAGWRAAIAGDDAAARDGTGINARFEGIAGMAYEPTQNALFVSEEFGCRLRRIDVASAEVKTLVGSLTSGCVPDAGADGLRAPTAMVLARGPVAAEGDVPLLFFSDRPYIRAFNPATGAISIICGAPFGNGPACSTRLVNATDLAFDPDAKTLYFREAGQIYRSAAPYLAVEALGTDRISGQGLAIRMGGSAESLFVGALTPAGIEQRAELRVASPGVISTTLAGSTAGWIDSDLLNARFEQIGALSSRSSTSLTIADLSSLRALEGNRVSTLAGRGRTLGELEGVGTAARLNSATLLTAAPANLIYFFDPISKKVRSFDLASRELKAFKDVGDIEALVHDGTSLLMSTQAGSPGIYELDPTESQPRRLSALTLGTAVTTDGKGRLFGTKNFGRQIVAWSRSRAEAFDDVAGSTSGSDDGVGPTAGFGMVVAMCHDASRNQLVVLDTTKHSVRLVALDGTGAITTLVGDPDPNTAYVDGSKEVARFELFDKVTCDGAGHAYLNDAAAGTIRRVDLESGSVITAYGARNENGFSLGLAPGRLNAPTGPLFVSNHLLVGSSSESVLVDITLEPPAK